MAGKRGAEKQMTQDNWDEEDDVEEAGQFKEASKEELQKRQFKRAKRRVLPTEETTAGPVFRGFAGFAPAKSNASSTTTAMALGAQLQGAGATTSTAVPASAPPFSSKSVFASLPPSAAASTFPQIAKECEAKSANGPAANSSRDPKFAVELRALNEAVLQWIGSHLKKNVYCILSPVFKDYAVYLDELYAKYPITEASNGQKAFLETIPATGELQKPAVVEAPTKPAPSFSFSAAVAHTSAPFSFKASGPAALVSESSAVAAPAPTFSFGSSGSLFSTKIAPSTFSTFNPSTKIADAVALSGGNEKEGKESKKSELPAAVPAMAGLFNFGAGSAATPSSSIFQFGTAKPAASTFGGSTLLPTQPGKSFLFDGAGPSTSTAAAGDDADEEEYVPPKPEVEKAVTEEGAVYSKRVKLFYKKDASYVDKGIGNLFIKKVDSKTQLVLRADTNLGNILLNIMLTDAIPVVRQGTNNVSIVCIANPPMDAKMDASKPVALLLRVKTPSDADELAAELNKHKK